jgi:RES domain-containing protein
MRAFRLCRANYPAYDGEGASRVGGRWNSKGTRVLYMSENRSLAVLEILVHLSASLPDRYVLGAADIPDDAAMEILDESRLPANWSTLDPREQELTRRMGDEWIAQQRSAVLSVRRSSWANGTTS